jgi:hypothetical protein
LLSADTRGNLIAATLFRGEGGNPNQKGYEMRIALIATAAALFLAPTAFAQTSNQGEVHASPGKGQSTASTQNIRAQIQKNLQSAGFTDIKVMPSSFLLRAKDKDGNPVMMVINPDSVEAVTEVGGGQANPRSDSTTGSTTPSQNSSPNQGVAPSQGTTPSRR